ncbi:unnamed protein product [Lathyrus sativus]|nr:unnamed protein product [Lathyrus sativus]
MLSSPILSRSHESRQAQSYRLQTKYSINLHRGLAPRAPIYIAVTQFEAKKEEKTYLKELSLDCMEFAARTKVDVKNATVMLCVTKMQLARRLIWLHLAKAS